MKKNIIIISGLLVLILVSCNTSNMNSDSKLKLDEDTTGYYAARYLLGIGEFRLGESASPMLIDLEKEIFNLVKENAKKRNEYFDQPFKNEMIDKYLKEYRNKNKIISSLDEESMFLFDNIILQLLPNQKDSSDNPSKCSYCPDVKIYKLPKYTISSIELSSLYLTCYKDTLIQLECKYEDKIEEALNNKYGKCKEKYVEMKLKYPCDGNTDGYERFKIWQNKNIKAELYTGMTNCTGHIDSYFKIFIKGKIMDAFIYCDNISKRDFEKKLSDIERNKLKNF